MDNKRKQEETMPETQKWPIDEIGQIITQMQKNFSISGKQANLLRLNLDQENSPIRNLSLTAVPEDRIDEVIMSFADELAESNGLGQELEDYGLPNNTFPKQPWDKSKIEEAVRLSANKELKNNNLIQSEKI